MVVLGVVLLVLTFANGGGVASLGPVLGVMFILVGVLRLRVERSR
jgi:hypothetical protein